MRQYNKRPAWNYLNRAIGYLLASALAIVTGIMNGRDNPALGEIFIGFGIFLAAFGAILLILKILNERPIN